MKNLNKEAELTNIKNKLTYQLKDVWVALVEQEAKEQEHLDKMIDLEPDFLEALNNVTKELAKDTPRKPNRFD